MSSSTTSETCSVVDNEGGALGGGVSIPEITSYPASESVTSNSPEVQRPATPLITANLASHAGSATTPGDSGTSGSVGSSSFDLLDEAEQAEILAMSRLQRRAEYSAARAEGRSARRTGTTRGRDTSVDSAVTVSLSSSDSSSTQSLVADFENLAMTTQSAASNPTRTTTRSTAAALASLHYNLAFARELAAYLRSKTAGTPEIRGLRGWQVLARAGGVTDISNSIPEIIRVSNTYFLSTLVHELKLTTSQAIKTRFVNIYDVLAALESGRVATGFAHAGELALYTFRNGKIMGKAQAKAKQMLKVFLKELA
jgi:hypothetical protein